jgi:hypothetical protein
MLRKAAESPQGGSGKKFAISGSQKGAQKEKDV